MRLKKLSLGARARANHKDDYRTASAFFEQDGSETAVKIAGEQHASR